eukprot:Nk52_evm21s280 gene=Nk52_evmTU21s280
MDTKQEGKLAYLRKQRESNARELLENFSHLSERVDDETIDGAFDLDLGELPEGEVLSTKFSLRERTEMTDDELKWRNRHRCESVTYPEDNEKIRFKRIVLDEKGEVAEGHNDEDSSIASSFFRFLGIRQKYMEFSLQDFCPVTRKELRRCHSDCKSAAHFDENLTLSRTTSMIEICSEKHPFEGDVPGPESCVAVMKDGVFNVYGVDDLSANSEEVGMFKYIKAKQFWKDMHILLAFTSDGPSKSFAFRRLKYLESKFGLHLLVNEIEERAQQRALPHRDFYNVRKVDTHVHLASCMNQKHLLRFIKKKLKTEPKQKVCERNGKVLTLEEVFHSLNLTAYDLSIDTLDMHADKNTFHRFDKFNLKYNPIGESRLREIFMKTDNMIGGRYFAEVIKEVVSDLEDSKYQHAEYRVSVYGRSPDEWTKLADWAVENDLYSDNVRWLIQVPRLYNLWQKSVKNFAGYLDNIFKPLFEVSIDPSSNPNLHKFLKTVVGFDSVDDESKPEVRLHRHFPSPDKWDEARNPPYSYYLYYMYSNISVLNQYRNRRGFSIFKFRPHCGEAGSADHLASAYLTSESINHGILLRKVPVLQYLYYLSQMGLAMSPLSNNSLFLNYGRNPCPDYIRRGLNVSLSTDDPLQFHITKEPLIEEYSIACQVWKLSSADMCELAKNSIVQSGFEKTLKKKWLGEDYEKPGSEGNDMRKTNVPNIRAAYRYETLLDELRYVCQDIEHDLEDCPFMT